MLLVHFWWIITSATNAFYGIVSGWLGDVGIVTGLCVYLYQKNCHVPGCRRLGKHPISNGKYVVCGKHHPDVSSRRTYASMVLEHKKLQKEK